MRNWTDDLQLLAELKAQNQEFMAVEEDIAATLCPASTRIGDVDYDFRSVASILPKEAGSSGTM